MLQTVHLLFRISLFQLVTLKNQSAARDVKSADSRKAVRQSSKTERLHNTAVVAVGTERGRNTRSVMMTNLRRY